MGGRTGRCTWFWGLNNSTSSSSSSADRWIWGDGGGHLPHTFLSQPFGIFISQWFSCSIPLSTHLLWVHIRVFKKMKRNIFKNIWVYLYFLSIPSTLPSSEFFIQDNIFEPYIISTKIPSHFSSRGNFPQSHLFPWFTFNDNNSNNNNNPNILPPSWS